MIHTDTALQDDDNAGAPKPRKPRRTHVEIPKRRADDQQADTLRREVIGIATLAVSLCLFLALVSFSAADLLPDGPAAQTGQTSNLIGPVGASIADIFFAIFGVIALLLPLGLAVPGAFFLTGRRVSVQTADALGYPMLLLCGAMLAHLLMAGSTVFGHDAGGLLGSSGAEILRSLFGLTGAYILTYSILALTFVITTRISLVKSVKHATMGDGAPARFRRVGVSAMRRLGGLGSGLRDRAAAYRARRRVTEEPEDVSEAKVLAFVSPRAAARSANDSAPFVLGGRSVAKTGFKTEAKTEPKSEAKTDAKSGFFGGSQAKPSSVSSPTAVVTSIPVLNDDLLAEAAFTGETSLNMSLSDPLASFEDVGLSAAPIGPGLEPLIRPRLHDHRPAQLEIPLSPSMSAGQYQLPPLSLLDYVDSNVVEISPDFLHEQADRLLRALETYKIKGRVTEIRPGPVVTMFEFEPAPGVRISTIAKLSDDLAMALKALKVRIEAPIAGKGVVGFEVPNAERETVWLKEIIGDERFSSRKHTLPIALGKAIDGTPVIADLAKMPHLLVAGTTGSGKSVGVNGMITSLLYHAGPEDVRFIMVDPKMLELSIYEGIPHLLLPVVTDSKKAAAALRWTCDEMDRRYEVMKNAGVRDIRGYNAKLVATATPNRAASAFDIGEPLPLDEDSPVQIGDRHWGSAFEDKPVKLPYIVVVIDEFADLMMVAGKEVEFCVARISQKARAAGIHLILATQRPSTDVITGVIKANFPTRIAFQVSSGIDSRTILTCNGAENLLGKGDMLFIPPETGRLKRVHGAFVSEEEIHKVVANIRAQAAPQYMDESVLRDPNAEDEDDASTGDMDPMYEDAVRLVLREGRASTSHLQRRMALGYNRAARIIDQMESDGLLGAGEGAKPRQINQRVMADLVSRWDGDSAAVN